jgi:conjugal transfer pilus assembly protein TraK
MATNKLIGSLMAAGLVLGFGTAWADVKFEIPGVPARALSTERKPVPTETASANAQPVAAEEAAGTPRQLDGGATEPGEAATTSPAAGQEAVADPAPKPAPSQAPSVERPAAPAQAAPNVQIVPTTPLAASKNTAIAPSDKKAVVVVYPSVNEIISISRGHINKIITPFERPVVKTASDEAIETSGSAMFVTSTGEAPITMFVSERGEEDERALSLTLLPRTIPPREIALKLVPLDGNVAGSSGKAKKWERQQEYLSFVKKTMKALALGEQPRGYAMRPVKRSDPLIVCAQKGFEIETKQALEGNDVVIMVGKMSNVATNGLEFYEPSCNQEGLLAIASWPSVYLEPGESVEVYAVFQKKRQANTSRVRPSVLEK